MGRSIPRHEGLSSLCMWRRAPREARRSCVNIKSKNSHGKKKRNLLQDESHNRNCCGFYDEKGRALIHGPHAAVPRGQGKFLCFCDTHQKCFTVGIASDNWAVWVMRHDTNKVITRFAVGIPCVARDGDLYCSHRRCTVHHLA